jgi:phytoene dehydrogenase-like protein
LSPLDIERIFGLQNGCIMHTSLALHQLAYNRSTAAAMLSSVRAWLHNRVDALPQPIHD